jgi:hypothetical protein
MLNTTDMNKYFIVAICILLTALALQRNALKNAMEERDRFRQDTENLLTDMETYKTKDSLNVARIGTLRLTLDEFKKYRKEDAETIEQLKMKGRDLESIVTAGSQTTQEFTSYVRDTIIMKDTISVPARCIEYHDAWMDFSGCMADKSFVGSIEVRDTIHIVESIKRKRFLGFLWKTKKIKDRKVDLLSRNPNTKITTASSIMIE